MKWITTSILLLLSSLSFADCVILIHGLGRSDTSMKPIEKILILENYTVINTHYWAKGKTVNELSKEVIPHALLQCPKRENIHFVTHSLGGILLRDHLNQHEIPKLKRVVMLGPPNKGSEIADVLENSLLSPLLAGETILELGTDNTSKPNTLGDIDVELGIIAGNQTINPILSMIIPGRDDGKVSVENTKLDTMSDHIILPVSHTFIMQNSAAIEQIVYFLKNGCFNREK